MLKFTFDKPQSEALHLICLGAHSDDIEIGCGGALLKLIATYPNISITWVVFSAIAKRADEARGSAEEFLRDVQNKHIVLKEFRDGYFPANVSEIKDVFEELKVTASPDLILTHYRNDLHQDHRQLCELTWNTWRDHLILEYEIPKYEEIWATRIFLLRWRM